MPISFFEDGGDVAYAAVVDVCPHELSLLHIKLTERARDILFSNERMFLARDTTALAIALPFGSDVKRRIVGCLGGFCKNPDTVSVEPYSCVVLRCRADDAHTAPLPNFQLFLVEINLAMPRPHECNKVDHCHGREWLG